MNESFFSADEQSLVKANLKYGGIGLAVGIIICLFETLFYKKPGSGEHMLINVLCSIFISLSITNCVRLYERLLRSINMSFLQYVAGFYVCSLVGMFLGTEITHVIICIAYQIPFVLFDGLLDYRLNLLVVVVVTTLLLVYQAQKTNMRAQLKSKELDIAKEGQLRVQAELQTLQAKINPHFLYNSLNSIASLVHDNPVQAEEMTLKLSTLFRYSINSMQESFSTVKEEIEILNTYLDIEKIRFGKRVSFEVSVEGGLAEVSIPRFLIQPLVENALKHGLNKVASGTGQLKVLVSGVPEGIEVTVADNGAPFPAELQVGYGLQSTYDKLQLLYGKGYELKITNEPEKYIKITLPVKA